MTIEGLFSNPIFIHLASALPLPDSVVSSPRLGTSPLPPVSRSLSTLSLVQKAQNMHDGNPAHFQSLTQLASVQIGTRHQSQADIQARRSGDMSRRSGDFTQSAKKKSMGSLEKSAKPPNPMAKKHSMPAKKPPKLL
jgi:hypothetical protein